MTLPIVLPVVLLVIFLVCGLVYARAAKELQRLEKLRIEKETPHLPNDPFGVATNFARKMGVAMAPNSDELKNFCEKNGHGEAYAAANRRLYSAIAIALLCAFFIVKMSPGKPVAP